MNINEFKKIILVSSGAGSNYWYFLFERMKAIKHSKFLNEVYNWIEKSYECGELEVGRYGKHVSYWNDKQVKSKIKELKKRGMYILGVM